MNADEGLAIAEGLAGLLGEAGPLVGLGLKLARKALEDHGEEGGRAHLAAMLELEAQAAARAKWGG